MKSMGASCLSTDQLSSRLAPARSRRSTRINPALVSRRPEAVAQLGSTQLSSRAGPKPSLNSNSGAASRLERQSVCFAVLAESSEKALDDALLAPGARAGLTTRLQEITQRHHRLGHRAMAARRAQVAEGRARHVAGALDIADIAYGDVQVARDLARNDGPLHALRLQPEVGELGNEVDGGHPSQVGEEDALDDASLDEPRGQRVERGLGKLGALDPTQGIVIGEKVEVGEGLQVGLGAAALEPQGVGLDAIEQRGGQALADLDVGGPQILDEDG